MEFQPVYTEQDIRARRWEDWQREENHLLLDYETIGQDSHGFYLILMLIAEILG